jgi:mitochondrial fission protein ELM1
MNDSLDPRRNLSCWIMTTGEAGMRSQVIGLAESIGISFQEKTVSLKAPWRWLPGHLSPYALMGVGKGSDPLTPPWPDLLITCGRRSVALAIAIKKASRGKTFTVHIQDPRVPPEYFDMVVPPGHDQVEGKNVYSTVGALHKITPEKLKSAAGLFSERFAGQPRPLVSVLIGGNSKSYKLTPEIAVKIASELKNLADQGYGMVVTFSRRTGAENEALIRKGLEGMPVFIWDGKGENPYLGMLALADYILVTSDSASMITEASATGKPIMIIDLAGGSKKFDAFHATMRDEGIIRTYRGELQNWTYRPLDETGRIAAIVYQKLCQHVKHRVAST